MLEGRQKKGFDYLSNVGSCGRIWSDPINNLIHQNPMKGERRTWQRKPPKRPRK